MREPAFGNAGLRLSQSASDLSTLSTTRVSATLASSATSVPLYGAYEAFELAAQLQRTFVPRTRYSAEGFGVCTLAGRHMIDHPSAGTRFDFRSC